MKLMLARITSDPFQTSMNKLSVQELPIKTMFKMRKIINTLRTEIQAYDESRNARAKNYAEKDEKGEPVVETVADANGSSHRVVYKMDNTKTLLFFAEIADLALEEVEVPEILYSELGPNVKLNSNDLANLLFIVEDPE